MEYILGYVAAVASGLTVVLVVWLIKSNATKNDVAKVQRDVDRNTGALEEMKGAVETNTATINEMNDERA